MATLPEKIYEVLTFDNYDDLKLCDKNLMKLTATLSHNLVDLFKEKGKCEETLELATICVYTFEDEYMSLATKIFAGNAMPLLSYENFPYFRKVVINLAPALHQARIMIKT